MTHRDFHLAKTVDGSAYEVDTDRARLDLKMVHDFLKNSHWAKDISFALMKRAIDHSMPFGLYRDGKQVGFARVVTDRATFAYMADVFLLPSERDKGLGQWLVESVLAHPGLKDMRRWLLGTRNAQALYKRCGFVEPPAPFTYLEKYDPAIHERQAARGAAGRLRAVG